MHDDKETIASLWVTPTDALGRAERGELLHLYQMLLHSPPLAEGWLHYLTRVRQRLALPGDLRELVIMQVAHLNGAPYEAAQHAPIARREGVPAPALDALPRWRDAPDRFTPTQQLALALADTMTRQVQVPAAQMQAVRDALGERQACGSACATSAARTSRPRRAGRDRG